MTHRLGSLGLGFVVGSSMFLVQEMNILGNCMLLGVGLLIFMTDERVLDWCYQRLATKEDDPQ